jgi:hypothetical protein
MIPCQFLQSVEQAAATFTKVILNEQLLSFGVVADGGNFRKYRREGN